MSEDVYRKLQQTLDRLPLGFPPTESGVEIEILKNLFSEEEAETALLLSPLPEEPGLIAERSGRDAGELETQLEEMSRKGLIYRTRHGGKTFYNMAPFMIGLYEYSVERMDARLALLFKEYYETAYMREMAVSNVPGFRVFPINETIENELVLYPYMNLVEEIKGTRVIAVADCVCRKEGLLTGDGCDYPLETCLSFGVAAEYYIENAIGRKISVDEALRILEEADRAGLVHAGVNTKHLSNICNCCPCCCASMKGITGKGLDRHMFLNALFEAAVDDGRCTACGECLERCPVAAIELEDYASIDRDRCLGCGLCAGTCPSEAISVRLREDREEPFERVLDLGLHILEGKLKRKP
jgi:electron transport complex protein RnfB